MYTHSVYIYTYMYIYIYIYIYICVLFWNANKDWTIGSAAASVRTQIREYLSTEYGPWFSTEVYGNK